MRKLFLIVLAIAFSFTGCEKDDICDANTPTTPRLIVTFYDFANPTVLKKVTQLNVTGVNESVALNTFDAVDTISLPLKTTEDFTKYTFTLNASDPTHTVTDLLQFNYSREDIFVSRACGFKTIFDLNRTSLPAFILNDDATVSQGNWIKKIEVIQPNINNENETHLKIYF